MHRLLYYPHFEIQDQNFLKFALLYIDEIRPIIPEIARETLGDSMKNILKNTDLINPYSPNYENGYLASFATIKHLENSKHFDRYGYNVRKGNHVKFNYTLYQDKYSHHFEDYCLENGLGERCNKGILLNEDVAYTYMSILAEIISKETETDMITDNRRFSDPILNNLYIKNNRIMWERLETIQKEIQFYVPVDFRRIPIEKFIDLRSDYRFESARRDFVDELNVVLDAYDENEEVDLSNIMECKKEINGLLKEIFISCAAVAVGVHSFGNIAAACVGTLDFWGNVGNAGISLDVLKQHCCEAREYVARIERKRQARKYLAKIRQLRPETL